MEFLFREITNLNLEYFFFLLVLLGFLEAGGDSDCHRLHWSSRAGKISYLALR